MIVQFLCGIGILLFGVSVMSSSFEKLCGTNFKHKIAKYGNSKTKNALLGIGLDFVMQSSTASISLIMGLCGAGVLTLSQTIAIMMGTNIASAVSVLWVALQGVNIVSYFGLLIVIGFFIKLFAKSNVLKNWGLCLCGFGLIFCGMSYMGIATKSLSSSPEFIDFFFNINNPWILFALGLLLSALINSSLGTTAIVSSILISNPELLSIQNASYIIYAMNIGTCFTLILIGLTSKNKQSLKVSLSYLMFNIVGAIIFCPLTIWDWITPVTSFISDATLKIIFVNIIFNIVTIAICLPLVNVFAKLLDKMIPNKNQEDNFENISTVPTLGFVQLGSNSISYFKETCRTLGYAMDYTRHSSKNRKTEILKHAENMIIQSKEMNKKLFELDAEYAFENEKEKRDINNMFIGIEKANVNIEKLVYSCEYNNKKIKFNETQQEILNQMRQIIEDNILLSRTIVSNSLTNGCKVSTFDVQKIVDNMSKITVLKVEAKQSVISENDKDFDKLTSYLNVINYFEEITTNLTDIILNIAEIETKKDI